ncbi:MAG: hypothetical protein ABIO70_29315 [Pseudomonadota bacterium]
MRTVLLLPVLAIACTPAKKDPKDSAADTSPPVDTAPPFDTGLYGELHGARPAVFLEAPEFEATAHNGELRGREHLLGHPTVLWFYPMASTSG